MTSFRIKAAAASLRTIDSIYKIIVYDLPFCRTGSAAQSVDEAERAAAGMRSSA